VISCFKSHHFEKLKQVHPSPSFTGSTACPRPVRRQPTRAATMTPLTRAMINRAMFFIGMPLEPWVTVGDAIPGDSLSARHGCTLAVAWAPGLSCCGSYGPGAHATTQTATECPATDARHTVTVLDWNSLQLVRCRFLSSRCKPLFSGMTSRKRFCSPR
jgi:hypothetical protein